MDEARREELDAKAEGLGTDEYKSTDPQDHMYKTVAGEEIDGGPKAGVESSEELLAQQRRDGDVEFDDPDPDDDSGEEGATQKTDDDPPPPEGKEKDKDRVEREKLYQSKYQSLKAEHDALLANLDAIGTNPLDALEEEETPEVRQSAKQSQSEEGLTFEEGTTLADLTPAQLQQIITGTVTSNLTPQVTEAVTKMQRREVVKDEHRVAGESLGAYAASLGLTNDQITEAITDASNIPVNLKMPGGYKAVAKVAAQGMLLTSLLQAGDAKGSEAAREIARRARAAQMAGSVSKRGLPARKQTTEQGRRLTAMQKAQPQRSTDMLDKR